MDRGNTIHVGELRQGDPEGPRVEAAMEVKTLEVTAREKTKKGAARRLRREELIPAICYGKNQEPLPLSVRPRDLTKVLDPERGWNTVIRLHVAGEETREALVMVKDHQVHPLRRDFIHVDFVAVEEDHPVEVVVPVVVTGRSVGVKEGGILQQVHRSLTVQARPFDIPAKLTVDITTLGLGQAFRVEDMVFPKGVSTKIDPRTPICNVVAVKEEKAATEVTADETAATAVAAEPAKK